MNNLFVKTESSMVRGIPRTRFKKPFTHKTSFNAGKLIPLLCERVYPGTTIKMDLHTITRMATPVNPIMDDIYQEFHFFFVPFRVILENQHPFSNSWKSANKNWDKFISYSDWNGVSSLKLPTYIIRPDDTFAIRPGNLGHYLGLPLGGYPSGVWNQKINLLPLGAYLLIYNQFFRDENYQTARAISETTAPSSGDTSLRYSHEPLNVNEMHDPFTSVLPSPQKGPEVTFSLGEMAPVVTNNEFNDWSAYPSLKHKDFKAPLQFYTQAGDINKGYDGTNFYRWPLEAIVPLHGVEGQAVTGLSMAPAIGSDETTDSTTPYGSLSINQALVPANLVANLSQATALTINQLRDSIVLQHYFETLARSGSRYNEWLLGFFDVVSPDARLQRAEYIVGKRVHINISEVLQTSGEAVNDTVLGTTGAVSRTVSSNDGLFTYSATEHGYLMCVSFVRHALSYSQGISRVFTDVEALDYYNPIFNGIGEQPIFKREVLAPTSHTSNIKDPAYENAGSEVAWDDILGFNEPWWDVRYSINRASGLLDPVGNGSLRTWTLTKAFTTPTITGAEIRVADDTTIDRVIRVQNEDQFIGEYLFDMEVVAKIPYRSVPGVLRI